MNLSLSLVLKLYSFKYVDEAYLKHIIETILNIKRFIESIRKKAFSPMLRKQYVVLMGSK